jgi:hypothetical protein
LVIVTELPVPFSARIFRIVPVRDPCGIEEDQVTLFCIPDRLVPAGKVKIHAQCRSQGIKLVVGYPLFSGRSPDAGAIEPSPEPGYIGFFLGIPRMS